jgi:hypothetical protein
LSAVGSVPVSPLPTTLRNPVGSALVARGPLPSARTESVLIDGVRGQRVLVELKAQAKGFVVTRVSTFNIEGWGQPTKYGFPAASEVRNVAVRSAGGGSITSLEQATRRVEELVRNGSLTATGTAEAKALEQATALPKPVAQMSATDKVKYLLHEALRQLPVSAAREVKEMLTSPQTWLVMGAFLVAQAVPGVNVVANLVGSLLLGNDIVDTGGKMAGAFQSALGATSQAELVQAGKALGEALAHAGISGVSAYAGNRLGSAIKTRSDTRSMRNLASTVERYKQGNASAEQVRQAANAALSEKKATGISNRRSTEASSSKPPPSKSVALGREEQRRIPGASSTPTSSASATAGTAQNPMPQLLKTAFAGQDVSQAARDAFKARATAWARQTLPQNTIRALQQLATDPTAQRAMVRQTALDMLTGTNVESLKTLGASQPTRARQLAAVRQRLGVEVDRAHPNAGALLADTANASSARAALLRKQVGIELGGSTPLASAVQAYLKTEGVGERALIKLLGSSSDRVSVAKNALTRQFGSSSATHDDVAELATALDKSLALVPNDAQRMRFLQNLSASPQTVNALAGASSRAEAGAAKQPKTQSRTPPSNELKTKPELPNSLVKVRDGRVAINIPKLTEQQLGHYRHLRQRFTASEVNDIVNTVRSDGVGALASRNGKYLDMSAKDMAAVSQLSNGLNGKLEMHDVTHTALAGKNFKYRASEWDENVGNGLANVPIDEPSGLYSFTPVTSANGARSLKFDEKARQAVDGLVNAPRGANQFGSSFFANSVGRVGAALTQAQGRIGQGSASSRYVAFRKALKDAGQLPRDADSVFEARLKQAYTAAESKLEKATGKTLDRGEMFGIAQPIALLLRGKASARFQQLPVAEKRRVVADGVASVLTANEKFPDKISLPSANDKTSTRFSGQWFGEPPQAFDDKGYLRLFLEKRAMVRREFGVPEPTR